ncbi:MAG: hypothetical protein R3F09_04085 [Burkholderiaceae bacterium]
MASIQRIAPSLVGMLLAGAAQAEVPAIFQGADLKLGDKLIAEHKCNQCHAQKWGRDGLDIYRPKGRIHDAGKLRGMVDYCSNQLGLTLFPEEITAIAAALNRDHYHFQR